MIRLSLTEFKKLFGKNPGPDKRPKYGNKKCSWGGKNFDSIHERDRYIALFNMRACGEISNLRTQVRFQLTPPQYENGKLVEQPCYYVADFVYCDRYGKTVVEDAKSEITRKNQTYIIKRKLMLERYGIRIVEV